MSYANTGLSPASGTSGSGLWRRGSSIGSFIATEEEDLYVWIRRFDSDEHLAAFSAAYYGSDEWKNELAPLAKEMIDSPKTVVTRIEATSKSVIR